MCSPAHGEVALAEVIARLCGRPLQPVFPPRRALIDETLRHAEQIRIEWARQSAIAAHNNQLNALFLAHLQQRQFRRVLVAGGSLAIFDSTRLIISA